MKLRLRSVGRVGIVSTLAGLGVFALGVGPASAAAYSNSCPSYANGNCYVGRNQARPATVSFDVDVSGTGGQTITANLEDQPGHTYCYATFRPLEAQRHFVCTMPTTGWTALYFAKPSGQSGYVGLRW